MIDVPARSRGRAMLARGWRACTRLAFVAVWIAIIGVFALTWGVRFTPFNSDVIIGESMEPTIGLWSVTLVRPVPAESIRAGDIIAYQHPDRPQMRITHRVVKVERVEGKPVFQTRGDNNDSNDPWRTQYVEGTAWLVEGHVPWVGRAILAAQQPVGRVALVIVPTLVLLMQFLLWLWRPQPEDDLVDEDAHEQFLSHGEAA